MSKAAKPVLLVGGVPGIDVETVLTTVSTALGDLAIGLTDGEVGPRRLWVVYLTRALWGSHPDVVTVKPTVGVDPAMVPEGLVPADWLGVIPQGYHDLPWFSPKPGVEKIRTIGITTTYPEHAASSFRIFTAMRDEGRIHADARFKVCIPFPDDAVRIFTKDSESMNVLTEAYVEIVKNDVQTLCKSIPHEDLVLQWDVNWETIAIEHDDYIPDTPPLQFKPDTDPWDRYQNFVKQLNGAVPNDVPLGLHICYGDLHHKHFRDPEDLSTSVAMANRATAVSPRPINYFHFAVPRHRHDDEYFEPLSDIDIGDATIYAGLVHYTDGVEGSIKRLKTFKRYFDGPTGVATECGLGHRPLDQDLITLLEIHRDVALAI